VTCDDSDALALTFATKIFKLAREEKIKRDHAMKENLRGIV
jgi:hypothetical protein